MRCRATAERRPLALSHGASLSDVDRSKMVQLESGSNNISAAVGAGSQIQPAGSRVIGPKSALQTGGFTLENGVRYTSNIHCNITQDGHRSRMRVAADQSVTLRTLKSPPLPCARFNRAILFQVLHALLGTTVPPLSVRRG